MGDELDEEVKEEVEKFLKPLCNVIYNKGEYYIYQAETLLKQPGLTSELSTKSKADRYFVTNCIKSIAMKASEVVHDATVCELEDAFKGKDYSSKFKMLRDGEEVSDDEIA